MYFFSFFLFLAVSLCKNLYDIFAKITLYKNIHFNCFFVFSDPHSFFRENSLLYFVRRKHRRLVINKYYKTFQRALLLFVHLVCKIFHIRRRKLFFFPRYKSSLCISQSTRNNERYSLHCQILNFAPREKRERRLLRKLSFPLPPVWHRS